MKKLVWCIGIAILVCHPGWGATMCGTGSLASYVGLGTGGCMIGGDTVSRFQILAGQGLPAIDPATITVTPSGTSAAPVLTFDLNVNTALTLEGIFTYRIFGASFTSSTITGSNATTQGNGTVSDVQNLCGAGTFGADGVSVCSGTTLGPLAISSPDTVGTTFTGVPFLSVTDDFVVDGGMGGSAQAGRFADRFTANAVSTVPEPGTILITGLGTALFFTLKARSRRICEIN